FQARHRSLELIANGNLLGAWAVARPLQNDAVKPGWTHVVEWLNDFASSMPIHETCDIRALKHERMAVRAALRVELALRARDIPRAVHGTVAFFEAALWDHLKERTLPHPNKRLFRFHAPPEDDLVRERDAAKLTALSSKAR